jgi:hypothetical protein
MRDRLGRVRLASIVAVATGVLAAGCSGGHRSVSRDEGSPIAAVAESMASARTAHVRVTMGTDANSSVVSTGAFDFARGVGKLTQTVALTVGGTSQPTATSEQLYIGDTTFVQLDLGIAQTVPARVAAGKHWVRYDSRTGYLSSGFVNPFTELTKLKRRGVPVKDRGITHIDGQRVHRYTAVETRKEILIPGNKVFRVTDDLYIDARDRLVRLVAVSHHTGQTRIDFKNQIDFSDYGTRVDVKPPPASDVVIYSDSRNPTPRLRGSWSKVAEGTGPGFTWDLFRARADKERVCWSFESTPPLKPTDSNLGLQPIQSQVAPTAGTKPPRHNGHEASCTRTGDWQIEVQAAAFGAIGTHTVVVGVVRDDVVSVRSVASLVPIVPPGGVIGLNDSYPGGVPPSGATRPIPIDARFGGFVDAASTLQSSYDATMRDGKHHDCPVAFIELASLVGGVHCDPFENFTSPASSSQTLISP